MQKTTLALALLLMMPGLALAQSTSPAPPPAQKQPGQPPERAPEKKPPEKSEDKKHGLVLEGFVGPANFSHPDVGGLAYGGALRFLKHSGLRTDFGLLVWGSNYDASDLVSRAGPKFGAQQSTIGGGLELNVGFGISIVELMFGGGLGVTWKSGTIDSPLGGKIEKSNQPFYVSYGGELGINAGFVRPVFRLTRVVDTKFDPERGQIGDASALLFLFGLGLEVSSW